MQLMVGEMSLEAGGVYEALIHTDAWQFRGSLTVWEIVEEGNGRDARVFGYLSDAPNLYDGRAHHVSGTTMIKAPTGLHITHGPGFRVEWIERTGTYVPRDPQLNSLEIMRAACHKQLGI